jgi:hypothetical protein
LFDARTGFFARVVFLAVFRAAGRLARDVRRFAADFRVFFAGAGSGGCADTNECRVASHGGTPSPMASACCVV